jgi:hypothetical protein
MLLGIKDKETGKRYHICGGFPSASGKTNLAMMLPPEGMGDRYQVVLLRRRHRLAVGEPRGRQALRDEPGVRRLRCRQGHQRDHQPDGPGLHQARHRGALHQCRLQRGHPRGLVGGQDQDAARRHHRLDRLEGRADRRSRATEGLPWAHPNSRFTTTWPTCPTWRRTSRTPRVSRSTASSSVGVPAIVSRWSARSPTSPRACTTASPWARRRPLPPRASRASCAMTRCRCGRSCRTRGRLRRALAQDRRRRQGAADLRPRQLVPA